MTALAGKKNNYVDNQKLIDCIKEFQRQKQAADNEGGPLPVIPDYAARCILDLCEGISRRGNFGAYTYREDMVGDAIVDCVKAFGNFDTVKFNNPFGYFTLIGWRAMLRRIEEEHTETYLKFKSFRQAYSLGDHYFSDEDFVETNSSSGENKVNVIDVADQVIMNFEEKMRRKKEKIKNKAALKSGSKRKKTGIDRIFERGVKKK